MDRLINYITIVLLLVAQQNFAQSKFNSNSFSNNGESINETVNIQTNASTFIVGETLFYKIYCFTLFNQDIGVSKIAYVELIDKNKSSIFKHKLFLENGKSNSNFFIPTSLETGNYKLIGYTNLILNQSQKKINVLDINIINPYQNTNSVVTTDTIFKKARTNQNDALSNGIDLKLAKNEFTTRELVKLEVITDSQSLEKGEYSISVKKIDSLTLFPNANTQLNIILENNPIPELRGEIIHGKIIAKQSNNALDNKTISLSIQGQNKDFKITKTNNLGEFVFNLENINNGNLVLIQIVDPDRLNYAIELSKPPKLDLSSLSFPSLNLNQNIIVSLEERAIASQIENAYYNQKKDSVQITKNQQIFFDPQLITTYNLNDYTRFTSLKETIIEVTAARLELIKNKEEYTLNINDFDIKNEFPYPSLVLFDGILIQNIKDILDYNPKQLASISVVPGGYVYGSQKYNGIVIFNSKNNDYKLKEKNDAIIYPELLRPQVGKTYYSPIYSENNSLNRIPDYRQQLLWVPSFKVNNSQNAVSFYTSDIMGKYEIKLEGIDANGNHIKTKKIITIK